MKLFWRLVSLLFVCLMFLGLVPIPSGNLAWGTVPEWICAFALVAIAGASWQIVHSSDRGSALIRGESTGDAQLTRRPRSR